MNPDENQSAQPSVLAVATKCLLRRLSNSRAASVFARVALTCALLVFCISTSPTHAEERTYTNGDLQIRCGGDAPAIRGGRVVDGIRIKEKALESGGVEVTAVDHEKCYLVFRASEFAVILDKEIREPGYYSEGDDGEIHERGTPEGALGDEILTSAFRKCDELLSKGNPTPPGNERRMCRSREVRKLDAKISWLNFDFGPSNEACDWSYSVLAYEGRFRQINLLCFRYVFSTGELVDDYYNRVDVDWPND